MFETHEAAKMDVPGVFAEPGEHLWRSVYTRLNLHWLHVVVLSKSTDPDCRELRNLFLHQVEELCELSTSGCWDIVEVGLVSPAHLNGSNNWDMDSVAEILRARDPSSEHDQEAYVFVLTNGKRITVSYTCDEIELVDHETVYSSNWSC